MRIKYLKRFNVCIICLEESIVFSISIFRYQGISQIWISRILSHVRFECWWISKIRRSWINFIDSIPSIRVLGLWNYRNSISQGVACNLSLTRSGIEIIIRIITCMKSFKFESIVNSIIINNWIICSHICLRHIQIDIEIISVTYILNFCRILTDWFESGAYIVKCSGISCCIPRKRWNHTSWESSGMRIKSNSSCLFNLWTIE